MRHISPQQVEDYCQYPILIEAIREAFQKEHDIPKRHHHQYPNPKEEVPSTLLLMPAWDDQDNLGVKVINISPKNSEYDLPTVQGNYLLYDKHKGVPKAIFDAKTLTNKRTAAASALASIFLSAKSSSTMMMIGNGALAPELIRAHASVRPIEKVYIWGRSFEKSENICANLQDLNITIVPIQNYKELISEVDIVSCATMSADPLISGRDIRKGQHYDLLGACKPDMREADDEFITHVHLHVDNYEGATTEAGDLAIPLRKGTIARDEIRSDLFELCAGTKKGRQSAEETTCFKSVGHALEDLVAARLVFNSLTKESTDVA